jgi:hypothetical protein
MWGVCSCEGFYLLTLTGGKDTGYLLITVHRVEGNNTDKLSGMVEGHNIKILK